jgi:hypothetical protein
MLAVACAMLAIALPAWAGPFTDVPTDHWAYDAIDKLQAEGFVEGYPDGTFRGNRSFTRYEMAMVVARIWDRLVYELEQLQEPDLSGYATTADLDEVIQMVEDLRTEFMGELDALKLDIQDLSDITEDHEGRIRNLEDALSKVQISGLLRTRIEDIITNEVGYTDDMFEFEQKVWLALDAMPSDYLDVHVTFKQILSYLDSTTVEPLYLDEAWAKADMMKLMGWEPGELFNRFNLIIGRQYARFGEFGIAFDNGFEARPGILIDFGGDRLEVAAFLARSYRSGPIVSYDPVADDYVEGTQNGQEGLGIARVSYGFGESRSVVEPGTEFARLGFNYLATGVGNERGMGADLDTELLSSVYLNRLRIEYFQLERDQPGYNVEDEYGSDYVGSIIAWVDLFNNGNTRVSAAYADIGMTPGFSAIDNNPFEEYDSLPALGVSPILTGGNNFYGYESGLNPFPSDFVGIGVQINHTWWDVLNTCLTFYDGTNQAEDDYPVVIRLNVRYPLSDSSDIALEYVHMGIDSPTLAKLRGEFLVRF